MVSKAPVGPEDPRENRENGGLQDPLPTHLILHWQKVPEVTQDSQEPVESKEAWVSQETPAPEAPLAYPSEMKMTREAFQERWDPKAM